MACIFKLDSAMFIQVYTMFIKVEMGKSRKDCQRRRERSIVGLMYTVQNDEVMEVQRFDYPEKCQVLPNKRKIPSNNCKLFIMSKIGNR